MLSYDLPVKGHIPFLPRGCRGFVLNSDMREHAMGYTLINLFLESNHISFRYP